MLIKKKPTTNDIVAVRLTTREEIVGRVTASTTDTLTLAKPLAIQIHQHPQNGGMALGFAPYGLSTEEDATVVVYRSQMVTEELHVRDDVKQSYVQATSSIQAAPAGGGLIV